MRYYVYQLRLVNSDVPFYIGKGCRYRKNSHLSESSLKRQSLKNSIIKKAMKDGVEILSEILFSGLSEPEALNKEVELIAFYGRRDIGTGILANHTDGGDGMTGWKVSPETRKKIGRSSAGRVASELARERMSKSQTGKNHSPETKEKMSRQRRGKPKSEGHIENSMFGKWDANPAWLSADTIYSAWIMSGKPGRAVLKKIVGFESIDIIQKKFSRGWIPSNDETWKRYKGSR